MKLWKSWCLGHPRSPEAKNREKRVKLQYLFIHVYSKKNLPKIENLASNQIWLSAKFYVFEQYA